MAKVSSRGGKGREELKDLGDRNGWTAPREISMREIDAMSADQVLWEETFNADSFKAAFEREAVAKHNRNAMSVWDTRRKWREGVTKEETEKARIAGDRFATRFPSFERSLPNAEVMVTYMRDHDLDATKVESYVGAYKALMEEGKLSLAPAESADEFLRSHPELHDRRTSPLVATRHQRVQNTEAHFAQSAAATNKGSVTRMVDYPHEQRGVPPQPDKHSFRMKVRSMSASEIAQRCADDPAFKAALDALD